MHEFFTSATPTEGNENQEKILSFAKKIVSDVVANPPETKVAGHLRFISGGERETEHLVENIFSVLCFLWGLPFLVERGLELSTMCKLELPEMESFEQDGRNLIELINGQILSEDKACAFEDYPNDYDIEEGTSMWEAEGGRPVMVDLDYDAYDDCHPSWDEERDDEQDEYARSVDTHVGDAECNDSDAAGLDTAEGQAQQYYSHRSLREMKMVDYGQDRRYFGRTDHLTLPRDALARPWGLDYRGNVVRSQTFECHIGYVKTFPRDFVIELEQARGEWVTIPDDILQERRLHDAKFCESLVTSLRLQSRHFSTSKTSFNTIYHMTKNNFNGNVEHDLFSNDVKIHTDFSDEPYVNFLMTLPVVAGSFVVILYGHGRSSRSGDSMNNDVYTRASTNSRHEVFQDGWNPIWDKDNIKRLCSIGSPCALLHMMGFGSLARDVFSANDCITRNDIVDHFHNMGVKPKHTHISNMRRKGQKQMADLEIFPWIMTTFYGLHCSRISTKRLQTAEDCVQCLSLIPEVPVILVLNYTNQGLWRAGTRHVVGVWRRQICDLELQQSEDLSPENMRKICGQDVRFEGVFDGFAITGVPRVWRSLAKDHANKFLIDTWQMFEEQFSCKRAVAALRDITEREKDKHRGKEKRRKMRK